MQWNRRLDVMPTPDEHIIGVEQCLAACLPHPGPMVDGWSVATLNAVPRRLGSTTCFGIVPTNVHQAILSVEDIYRSMSMVPTFRLTPADRIIDGMLRRRGYQRQDGAVVMSAQPEHRPPAMWIPETPTLGTEWFRDLRTFTGATADRMEALSASLQRLRLPHLGAHVPKRAVGLVVVDGVRAGIFDVAVHPVHRRTGLGTATMNRLLAWATAQRAKQAILQVHPSNTAALELYRKLGFEEMYHYFYRATSSEVQPTS